MNGGKARSLLRLQAAGFRVPPFFIVSPAEVLDASELGSRCAAITKGSAEPRFAVRSSAEVEDGSAASYAGMFETCLFVRAADVAARIEDVRASGGSERAKTYGSLRGENAACVPSVIVQRMIDAEAAGVAFGRDPVDGSDRIVVTAASGVGERLVSGECNADTYRVDRHGAIVERSLAHDAAVLSDERVCEIARTVREIGAAFEVFCYR